MSFNQVIRSEVIFQRVIQLAENRESEFRKMKKDEIPGKIDLNELEKSRELDVPLREYLESLSTDEIRMILVVMHLGRGEDEDPPIGADEIYEKQLKNLFFATGPEAKKIEIASIVGKVPLARFLRTGLNLLNVEFITIDRKDLDTLM